jgi:hypothetical protein
MDKILIAIFVAMAAFGLAGCGPKAEDPPETEVHMTPGPDGVPTAPSPSGQFNQTSDRS